MKTSPNAAFARIARIGSVALTALTLSFAGIAHGQASVDLENEDNRIGYAMGVNVGQSIAAQGIISGIPLEAFMAGMQDSFADTIAMEETDIMNAIQTFIARQQAEAQAALAENLQANSEFLSQNGQRAGVTTLDSGLQYEVIEAGAGGASPGPTDSVEVHYHGTLVDGSVFDSSVDRGESISFGVNQVIAGWTEALQLMSIGDKWRLFIPSELAYGEASPSAAIPPNSALIFEVELIGIN